MRKTALIVTTQRHFNFGTLLQCYALQRYVEQCGYDVEVLDYLGKEYKISRYRKSRILLGDIRRNPLKRLAILKNYFRIVKRERLFKKFLKHRINLTPKQYPNFEGLRRNSPQKGIYIAGSDQIWNPRLGGFKPVYFLKFAPANATKISYAASFGIDKFNEEDARQLPEMLKGFQVVSCREQSGVELLKRVGVETSLVADPVFLLEESDWEHLEDENIEKKYCGNYILSYFLSYSKEKEQFVKSYFGADAKEINISVDDSASSKSILGIGPEQFISLIANSDFLITDSFHGIVFALIFQKSFYVMKRNLSKENSQDARILDLLRMLCLEDRWLEDGKLYSSPKKIDYNGTLLSKIAKFQNDSRQWLKETLH